MGEKVSIVIRAFNRLECTIKSLSHLIRNQDYDNYEVIVIDNNSTDGTKEWFTWALENKLFTKPVKYIRVDYNTGDWGGMVYALSYIYDGKYIMQLDNDILIDQPNAISLMVNICETENIGILQLKRNNVVNIVTPREVKKVVGGYSVGKIKRPVACFLVRRDYMMESYDDLLKTNRTTGKTYLGDKYVAYKVLELTCSIMRNDVIDSGHLLEYDKAKYAYYDYSNIDTNVEDCIKSEIENIKKELPQNWKFDKAEEFYIRDIVSKWV